LGLTADRAWAGEYTLSQYTLSQYTLSQYTLSQYTLSHYTLSQYTLSHYTLSQYTLYDHPHLCALLIFVSYQTFRMDIKGETKELDGKTQSLCQHCSQKAIYFVSSKMTYEV
jgi:hypothetical protein